MSTRPKPFYMLRVATLAALLVCGGAVFLIWMLGTSLGPFSFFGAETHANVPGGAVSIELRPSAGPPLSLKAAVERVGPQRLLLQVTNAGTAPASGAVLALHLLEVGRVLAIRGTQLGADVPVWKPVGTSGDIEISLPDIPAAAHRAWYVDLSGAVREDGS